MVGEVEFRRVMGHFLTGVTIVTSRAPDGEPLGLTVNAFTSVSLDPLLVLVCIHRNASGHDPLLAQGVFGVNVLSREQEELARRFATGENPGRFQGVDWEEGGLGCPFLPGSLAWLECRIQRVETGGDHSIILGEVVDCTATGGEPLTFFRGQLGGFRP